MFTPTMDQQPPDTQRYHPLPADTIRLLSLLPSSEPTAQISCTLRQQSLPEPSPSAPQHSDQSSPPAYEALSYVWGTEAPAHSILVDGHAILVRTNLFDALLALRLHDTPRKLWVDSICINQDDIAERNAQVKIMRRIYACATQVSVWLGAGDANTDAALKFIQRLDTLDPVITARLADGSDTDGPLLQWEDRKKVFHALGMKHGLDNHDAVLSGLKRIRDFAWWNRIWTVQEIVLARSATLICGRRAADWRHLVKLAAFAFDVAHYNTLNGFGGRPMDEGVFDEITWPVLPLYGAVVRLDDLSHRVRAGKDVTLEQLAWALLTRQATDPRDMIYGVLGLVTTAERTVVEVDYGIATAQVYASAMKAMILEYWERNRVGPGPLHLLQNSDSERDPALPSWVPDFATLHSFRATTLAVSGVGSALVLQPLYDASFGGGADDNAPRFLDGDLVMEVQGVLMDQVEELGVVCPRFANGREAREVQLRDIVDRWHELLGEDSGVSAEKGTEAKYMGGVSREEAFWRTVTFDLLLVDRDYFAGNPDRRDTRLPQGATGMPPTTPAQKNELFEGILDAPVPKTVLEKLQNRRFFITKPGGFFGLGPASMQIEDTICVLRGSAFPIVIRPTTDGRYHYIGEW